jgi:hypothetical protein
MVIVSSSSAICLWFGAPRTAPGYAQRLSVERLIHGGCQSVSAVRQGGGGRRQCRRGAPRRQRLVAGQNTHSLRTRIADDVAGPERRTASERRSDECSWRRLLDRGEPTDMAFMCSLAGKPGSSGGNSSASGGVNCNRLTCTVNPDEVIKIDRKASSIGARGPKVRKCTSLGACPRPAHNGATRESNPEP